MKIPKIQLIVLLIAIAPLYLSAQQMQKQVGIEWKGPSKLNLEDNRSIIVYAGSNLTNPINKNYSPCYSTSFDLPVDIQHCDVQIRDLVWDTLSVNEIQGLTYPLELPLAISAQTVMGTQRGRGMANVSFVPMISDGASRVLRLKSCLIDLVCVPGKSLEPDSWVPAYATESQLASGKWFKVTTREDGIYKITYEDLQGMGVDMASILPDHIRLFGYGGGMLPESNSIACYDDLHENAIQVVTAQNGKFSAGDYILFYGTGPDKITFNKLSKKLEHSKHLYSDYNCYFFNFDKGNGLRISGRGQSNKVPGYTSSSFYECVYHEKDYNNLIKSGKQWVGERMDAAASTLEFPVITFKNTRTDRQAWMRYRLTARTDQNVNISALVNDKQIGTAMLTSYSEYIYGTEKVDTKTFLPVGDDQKVSFVLNGGGTSIGWLDWFELNVQRWLKFTGGQMAFTDPVSVSAGLVTRFEVQDAPAGVNIWEVTDPTAPAAIELTHNGSVSSFVLETDSLRRFIAWDNSKFLKPDFQGKIPNQNLHGLPATDLLIIAYPDFVAQAERLATFHRTHDGMSVSVVTPAQVYNEFSGGVPDICAIRNLDRMLYSRESGKLRYVLLMGDGSYDYRDNQANNTNRIPTFQSRESLSAVYSFQSDDFYAQLDEGEGDDGDGLLDIGIGRFPVNTVAEAANAVDKCIFYSTNPANSLGEWRNDLCLVADDEDGNLHLDQVEEYIIPNISDKYPNYNIDKIYVDAYAQPIYPSGQRCPDANAAIDKHVEDGSLIIGYTGHGGEVGWASEGILQVSQINGWSNWNKMPVFMTATCEFSRFDDPDRTSAGEYVFLNPVGGSVAMFTTTRLANAGVNLPLTVSFYDTIFSRHDNQFTRFGDALAYAKNAGYAGTSVWVRNFVLLGDPAMSLALPRFEVSTLRINGKDASQYTDTVSAMNTVTLEGAITNLAGAIQSDFNGEINVRVFDKPRTLSTLGTDADSHKSEFKLQDNIIYQGNAKVSNGLFTVRFIVPLDIDYSYGYGKISYYANNGTDEAAGYSDKLLIGGSAKESGSDDNGPDLSLFMNNTRFVSGGVTNPNPVFLAFLEDESGINTTGKNIGHDLEATVALDGSTDEPEKVILNKYYNTDLDSHTKGSISYKFRNLSEGMHTLHLKAWDIYNNSSEKSLQFEVKNDFGLDITSTLASPNPFVGSLDISFEMNISDETVQVTTYIYDLMGSLVTSLGSEKMLLQGAHSGPIYWNGANSKGMPVKQGIYLAKIHVKSGEAETEHTVKLIKTGN